MNKRGKVAAYLSGFLDYIGNIEDHRAQDNQRYSVAEIIFLTVVGIFADCSNWKEIEQFGKSTISLLREYLPYKEGTPSDDTLRRFFRILDSDSLSESLSLWLKASLNIDCKDSTIALDGKSLCGSKNANQRAIHTISAYLCKDKITLMQKQVDSKSNEITAAPELLDIIDINGAVVTGDAMMCQGKIINY